MHSPHKAERLWFMRHLEALEPRPVPDRKRIHSLLAKSEALDKFLQLKFPNLKRVRLAAFPPSLNFTIPTSIAVWPRRW